MNEEPKCQHCRGPLYIYDEEADEIHEPNCVAGDEMCWKCWLDLLARLEAEGKMKDYKKAKEREVARALDEGEAEILRVSKKRSEDNEDRRKSMHDFIGKSLGKSAKEIEEHWNEVKDNYPNVQLYHLKSKERST